VEAQVTENVIRVTVWGENVHEQTMEEVAAIYPNGMHEAIAAGIREELGEQGQIRTSTLQEPEHGVTEDVLAETDVLTWWGHAAHEDVSDEVVTRVYDHVLAGMGLLVLHSAHYSKIFRRLMGTACTLRWREADDRELLWTVNPGHPIAEGVPEVVIIPRQEMYGEYFDIPRPDELVFISSFTGGEVFRSGCCFYRGAGRVFYFSPGHETYPIYHQAEIVRILANGVRWAYRPGPRRVPTDMSFTPSGWFEAGNP
jgi:trehalose utilization protein